jgi:hypothetical protein
MDEIKDEWGGSKLFIRSRLVIIMRVRTSTLATTAVRSDDTGRLTAFTTAYRYWEANGTHPSDVNRHGVRAEASGGAALLVWRGDHPAGVTKGRGC